MLQRPAHVSAIEALLRRFPVVAVLGARQVGKTTLARLVEERARGATSWFDLEDPRTLAELENPMLSLEPVRGLVVLDEIQHRPELFGALRVLADRPRRPARFLVLGSASPELSRQSAESLAGRVAYHELGPLGLGEVPRKSSERLWLRGGFPRSFLARSEAESVDWRQRFMRTFAERDLRQLGVEVAPGAISRFWSMLAHYHGQIWNSAELARSLDASEKTARHYLDVLCATFFARRLQPWFSNIGKRQVKSPKVYLSDSGLLHSLLGIHSRTDLLRHPKAGASWEGFALAQLSLRLGALPEECFFWGVHGGPELDLLVVRGRKRLGFEMKLSEAPSLSPSMRSAMDALDLDRLDVIHAGPRTFPLAPKARAVSLWQLGDAIDRL